MYLGKIAELAPSDALYAHPRHRYTGALLSAVPVADPEVATRDRKLLTGDVPSPANPPSGCRFHPRCEAAGDICSVDEPQLTDMGNGTLAACHFPIRDDEVASDLPIAHESA
jgi:oligopeptide/dipeptide ABC transporter ATP-binding protein